MNPDLKKEIKRLSNLVNYKDKSFEELKSIASINLITKDFKNSPAFQYDGNDKDVIKRLKEEQNLMLDRFKGYLNDYKIDKPSDLDTLKSLVFVEMLEIRIQKLINEFSFNGQFPSDKVTQQLISLQNQKASLKLKLGIDVKKEAQSELSKLEQLETRFKKYIEENRYEFTLDVPMICEKCNHEAKYNYLLRKRVKDFDAIKNPWYVGRFFFNYEIIKDAKDGKITKSDAWRYMSSCALGEDFKDTAFGKEYCEDYINWCIENWGLITSLLDKK